jgi:heme A synthase
MFAGYPLFAETQTGPLYPPTFLLFLALPPTLAFSWSVIVHFALAGWGMHVLVRRFGASFASCLLAGVTFAYSGFLITHVVHFNLLTGAALLPWALYFAAGLLDSARSGERIRPLDFFGLAAVAAGYFLGSHPYALFMALFATIVTAIGWHGLRALSPGALGIAGAWILGAALGAIQLFPAIDLLGRTSRSAPVERGFLTFGSFPPWNLSALANPDVFGTPVDGSFFGGLDWSHFAETCAYAGILSIGLAVAAIVLRRDRATFGFLVLAAAGLLLMLGKYTVVYRALEQIPVLQSTRLPARFALVWTLAIAALAGFGLDALLQEKDATRRKKAAACGAIAILLLTFGAWLAGRDARHPTSDLVQTGSEWPAKLQTITERAQSSTNRTKIISALAIFTLGTLVTQRRRAVAAAVPVLAFVDLASWGASFNPRTDPRHLTTPPPVVQALPSAEPRPRIFRQGVNEFWERAPRLPRIDLFTPDWKGNEESYRTGAWALPPNSQLLYHVDSGEGFTSLIPLQWLEWMGQPLVAGAAPRPDLTEAQADLLGIDAVISSGSGIAGQGWEEQSLPGDVWVSRNLNPLPRARLVTSWAVASRDRILEEVRRADYNCEERVYLEERLNGLEEANDAPTGFIPISAHELAPGEWILEVPASPPGVIVLAESFDPGWQAFGPRGERLPVVRADGLFCAIGASFGGGEVRMKYAPRALVAGAVTSATAVLASLLLFIFVLRLRAPSHPIARTPDVSPVPAFVISTVPIATAMIMIVSLAANAGNWRADRQESTLAAAAVRAWSAEAQGAYMANAWDAAAILLERAAKLAPEDEAIRHRQKLVEQKRAEAAASLKASSER